MKASLFVTSEDHAQTQIWPSLHNLHNGKSDFKILTLSRFVKNQEYFWLILIKWKMLNELLQDSYLKVFTQSKAAKFSTQDFYL